MSGRIQQLELDLYELRQQLKASRHRELGYQADIKQLNHKLGLQERNYKNLSNCFAVVTRDEPQIEVSMDIIRDLLVDCEVYEDFCDRKLIVRTRVQSNPKTTVRYNRLSVM